METFEPTSKGPDFFQTRRPGSAAKRRPRNTCQVCNEGWMLQIEELAKPTVTKLLLGQRALLTWYEQRFLASFLCLVSCRIEASGAMRSIPPEDRDRLRVYREPGPDWWISILRYEDADPHEYWAAFLGMQRQTLDDPTPFAAENCNTQVTTLLAGKMCAHIFSSTAWKGFRGYEGASLVQLWPQRNLHIDTGYMPYIDNSGVPFLHEAVARDGQPPLANG
jgi:hypothetical protein